MDKEYEIKERVLSEIELMARLFPDEEGYQLENVLVDVDGYRFVLKKMRKT